jgi:hypothetical protein
MLPTHFDLSCFQGSYRAARQNLLQVLEKLPGKLLQQHETLTHPLPGPDRQPLYLDWIRLGQDNKPEKLLVLISGTHGVEGFTGSAIQAHWLPYLAGQLELDRSTGVIILHALNPWGFAWLRRYDHEGIDLNRNFIDFNAPLPANPAYDQLHEDLFNTTSEPAVSSSEYWQARSGPGNFIDQVTRGQYRHADGLFYGGTAPSWSRLALEQLALNGPLHSARRVAVVDLHTGLGPYGYGEVINDHAPDHPGFGLAKAWYGENAVSVLLGESCSAPKTGLLDFFWHDLLGNRGCFVTLEYGTYSTDKLLGLSCDEQRYHNSYGRDSGRRKLDHPTVTSLHDFFYPADPAWRELVLFRAGQVLELALQGIQH